MAKRSHQRKVLFGERPAFLKDKLERPKKDNHTASSLSESDFDLSRVVGSEVKRDADKEVGDRERKSHHARKKITKDG